MIPDTFEELQARLKILYQGEEFSAAIKLVNQALETFPAYRTILDYWHFSLLAKNGDLEGALSAIDDAQNHASWFSDLILRRSPSLKPLQGDPRFEAAVVRNQQIAEQDQRKIFPFYVIRPEGKCQQGGNACPLLIGLHTNGGTVESSIEFWKPAATNGWLAAAIQSSQAWMKGAYIWDDREAAAAEIRKDYDALIEHYPINPWQIVLAGHGVGGETAIWLILNRSIDIRFFLAICPNGPAMEQLETWEEALQNPKPDEIRGYIITGELDESIPHEAIARIVEMFNDHGIRTELETVPGVESDYSPDYEAAILRGLNFLVG